MPSVVSKWICDECYSVMEYTHIEEDVNKVECPNCGNYWFVDDDDEYINGYVNY